MVGYRGKINTQVAVPEIPYNLYFDKIALRNELGDCDIVKMYSEDTQTLQVNESEMSTQTIDNEDTNYDYYVYFEDVYPGYAMIDWHGKYPSDKFLSDVTDMSFEDYYLNANSFYNRYTKDVAEILNTTNTKEYDENNIHDNAGNYISDNVLRDNFKMYKYSLRDYIAAKKTYLDAMNKLYQFEYDRDKMVSKITAATNYTQIN